MRARSLLIPGDHRNRAEERVLQGARLWQPPSLYDSLMKLILTLNAYINETQSLPRRTPAVCSDVFHDNLRSSIPDEALAQYHYFGHPVILPFSGQGCLLKALPYCTCVSGGRTESRRSHRAKMQAWQVYCGRAVLVVSRSAW